MSNPFIEESAAAFRSTSATPLRSAGADADEDYVDYGDGIRTPPDTSSPAEDYVDYGDGIRTPPGQGADAEEEYVDFGDGIRTPVPSANDPGDGTDLADFGSFEAELARPDGLPDPHPILGNADAVTHFGAGDVPAGGPPDGPADARGEIDAVGDFGSGEGGGAALGDSAVAAFVDPDPAVDVAPDLVADATFDLPVDPLTEAVGHDGATDDAGLGDPGLHDEGLDDPGDVGGPSGLDADLDLG